MPQTIKAGTRIETLGFPAIGSWPAVAPETCVICLWMPKINGPRPNHVGQAGPGWHVVKFDSDGGKLIMHENRFRIIV